MAIVLDDLALLSELCGTNDRNLRAFEDLLGAPVYSHGNEIVLDTKDESTQVLFKKMFNQLQDHVKLGQAAVPSVIQSIHESLRNGSSAADALKNTNLSIPHGVGKVFPRNANQAAYLEAIGNFDIVVAVGPAGTGKTFLAVAHALRAVLSRFKRRLILTRPVVEAGESLGYLPGDLEKKINPYLRPLYDAMEALIPTDLIRRLEDSRTIEVAPLAYMRGRTLSNSFILLDEAQNTTREQMKMFLTRIGEGSTAIVTGDVTQIDLPRKRDSGLLEITSILRPIQEIQFVFFDQRDVVRNPIVRKIVQVYADAENE